MEAKQDDNLVWDGSSNGGGLEMYSVDHKEVKVLPVKNNQLVFFEVVPGVSLHAVQEVMHEKYNNQRISIQGWFHCKDEIADKKEREQKQKMNGDGCKKMLSTLEQIKSGDNSIVYGYNGNNSDRDGVQQKDEEKEDNGFKAINNNEPQKEEEEEEEEELTAEDFEYLREYINPEYLNSRVLEETNKHFIEDSYIILGKFLKQELADQLYEKIRQRDIEEGMDKVRVPTDYQVGITNEENSGHKWQISRGQYSTQRWPDQQIQLCHRHRWGIRLLSVVIHQRRGHLQPQQRRQRGRQYIADYTCIVQHAIASLL
ncbi:Prolyl 3,4-dihydroxylase TPA1 [Zancudomyces culisetae]|uniref:Prolyl 3,4-dihydroxylase TPA1 n=1 Tax=Zancudomyces culisetae TaxID=1213189 RepID=A0A1R1PXB3_ZANCU|nr:Prolyl 3,4-dihydroxylase TPA1 [Zancudomyces culisetae]|eukprot:OMH85538.1 Prolyl 3,4-dihydroxylase TPA1 [Zancudomyces culisetae]